MTAEPYYGVEPDLGVDEFVDVLRRSTLSDRRPVEEKARIGLMLKNADIIVTARRRDGFLIGVSRCISDFAFCCYCSDLAVDAAYQRLGIGRRLLEVSKGAAGEHAHFILLAAPAAIDYYARVGMRRLDTAFDYPDWKRFADAE